MPPGSRSRGCRDCKQRKIKCDEKIPSCGKCEKVGIVCSGPLDGPIILAFEPHKRLKKQQRNAATTARKERADRDGFSSSQALVLFSPAIVHIQKGPLMRDSLALKLQEVLLVPHQSYNSIVPVLTEYAVSSELPTLQRAIWAASSALNGVILMNLGLIEHAQKTYALALRSLRRRLTELDKKDGSLEIEHKDTNLVRMEMVAVAVLFVWYEAVLGTNLVGWIVHAFGAARILLQKPPHAFQEGFGLQIFRTVRFMMVNVTLLTLMPTPFASRAWREIPFASTKKTGFDRLTDLMLEMGVPLGWINNMLPNGLPISLSAEANIVVEILRNLEERLKRFLIDYEWETIQAGGTGLFYDISEEIIGEDGVYHPKVRHFYSDEIAETMAHYDMCRMLLRLCKAAFVGPGELLTLKSEAMTDSASVLSIVPFSEGRTTTNMRREFFGLVCLLILIHVGSPNELHRNFARDTIDKAGRPNGLIGASPFHPVNRWRGLQTVWKRLEMPPHDNEARDDSATVQRAPSIKAPENPTSVKKGGSTGVPDTLEMPPGITEDIKLPLR